MVILIQSVDSLPVSNGFTTWLGGSPTSLPPQTLSSQKTYQKAAPPLRKPTKS